MQIIFGTKKLTESARAISVEKYEGRAVVTVEGQKGAKKSRRILFNNTASTLLGLESGITQQLVFAPIQDTRQVLIANLETIDEEARGEMITYRTSKNKVSYSEDTTEKGKASTTSFMCKELFAFFGEDDSQDLDFELNEFPSEGVEAFSLDLIDELQPLTNVGIATNPTEKLEIKGEGEEINETEKEKIELSLEKISSNEMDDEWVKDLEFVEDLSNEQVSNIVEDVVNDSEQVLEAEEVQSSFLNRVVVTE